MRGHDAQVVKNAAFTCTMRWFKPQFDQFFFVHYFCGYVLFCDTGNGIQGQACVVELVKMFPKFPKVTEGCGFDPLRGPFLKNRFFLAGTFQMRPNNSRISWCLRDRMKRRGSTSISHLFAGSDEEERKHQHQSPVCGIG